MNIWDCIIEKSFSNTEKETVTRLKRLPTEGERIFASYSSNKGPIFGIYRELNQPPKNQHPNEEMGA
jgi:hypothetical protein